MKVLVIAATTLRRMLRTRANIFFVFVFPMLLILVLGATFGRGATPRLGVVVSRPGALATALVRQLDHAPSLKVTLVSSDSSLLSQVERGSLDAGVEIPAGYDSAIEAGKTVTVRYLARPGTAGQQLGQAVRSAVDSQAELLAAARFAAAERAAPGFAAGLTKAKNLVRLVPVISVRLRAAGKALFPSSLG